ncbi:uncharacterized protein LOC117066576, partial [Trachypithecus francoisi]|uniref:uncharacterized protein LOC117066576 n=1 Tax=Trachypithecus francoisi TaxID=54180 RepID=UPI00141B8F00
GNGWAARPAALSSSKESQAQHLLLGPQPRRPWPPVLPSRPLLSPHLLAELLLASSPLSCSCTPTPALAPRLSWLGAAWPCLSRWQLLRGTGYQRLISPLSWARGGYYPCLLPLRPKAASSSTFHRGLGWQSVGAPWLLLTQVLAVHFVSAESDQTFHVLGQPQLSPRPCGWVGGTNNADHKQVPGREGPREVLEPSRVRVKGHRGPVRPHPPHSGFNSFAKASPLTSRRSRLQELCRCPSGPWALPLGSLGEWPSRAAVPPQGLLPTRSPPGWLLHSLLPWSLGFAPPGKGSVLCGGLQSINAGSCRVCSCLHRLPAGCLAVQTSRTPCTP